jgi:hypothetical protein
MTDMMENRTYETTKQHAARADAFLLDLLAAGPMEAVNVHAAGARVRLTRPSLLRAAKRLRIRYRQGWKMDAGRVFWCLPQHDNPAVARRFWRR